MIELLVFWVICGIVAAVIGSRKGAGGVSFLLGLLLGPLGIIISIVIKGNRIQCPSCREYIDPAALKCPKCQENIKKAEDNIVENETKNCPVCAEYIKLEAIKCRFCGYDFEPEVVAAEIEKRKKSLEQKLLEKKFPDGYISQEGIPGEAFCFGCRTIGTRSQMLYNEKLDVYYHITCLPKKTYIQ